MSVLKNVLKVLRWILLLLIALFLVAPVQAQEKELTWRRFDSELIVQQDGRVLVTETQEIEYLSGQWRNGGRKIPLDRVDGISDVRVSELGPGGETPLQADTNTDNNELQIAWTYPPAGPGDTRTFRIRYTVEGVIRNYPQDQQVRWQAVPPDRRFPVEASTVRLRLPGDVAPQDLKLESYPERLRGTETPEQNGASFTVRDVPAFEGFEIRSQFPAGTVQAPTPSWQQEADRRDQLRETVVPRNNLVLLGLGLLAPMLGLVGLLVLWLARGKDPGIGRDAESITTPPSDLPAPLVGVLLDERADVQDVVSSIVSLSERGIIRISQEQNDKLMGSQADYRLELIKPYSPRDLRTYERTLVDNLFASGDSVLLSDARGRFMAAVPAFKDQLYDEVVRAGLFKGNPERVRDRYRAVGIGVLVIGFLFGCVGTAALSAYADVFFIWLPALGLAAIGFGLLQLSRVMPVRTLNGAVEASRWRSFRSHLANIERSPDIAQDKGAFERYLSYATAFNLGRSWLQKFASVGTPAPGWYSAGAGMPWGSDPRVRYDRGGFGGPVIIVPPFGGYGGGGHQQTGEGGSSVPDAEGGGAFDNTGLFDFGDGRGALDKTSGGFGDLLDMASDAFGGGDWGGGGGGGFGGGSGGGGADFS